MIQPVNKNILVELSTHQQSASGLELPVKEEDKHLRSGKVIEVSSEISEIKSGDIVIFGEYAYDTLLFEGKYHIFINYEDIIGKIC